MTVGAGQVGGLACTEHAQGGRADVLFNVMPLSVDKPGDPLHRFSGFSASATQCRPLSTGTVHLQSANPTAAPRIVSNYLRDPHDVRVLVAGLRQLREIYAQAAFSGLVTGEEYFPGNAVVGDKALEAFARARRHGVPPGRNLPHGRGRARCGG